MNLSILILNELIFVHVMYVRLVVYLLKKKKLVSMSSHSQRKPRAFPFKK